MFGKSGAMSPTDPCPDGVAHAASPGFPLPLSAKRSDPMAKSKKPAKKQPAPARAKAGRRTGRKPATAPKRPGRKRNPEEETAPTAGAPANFYALLIASDFYLPNRLPEGSYPNLAGCVRDVEHVEQFLRRRLGLTDDRLIKLTSTDVGAREPKEPPERRPTYEN